MDHGNVKRLLQNYTHTASGWWESGWDFWLEAPQNQWFALDPGLDARTVYAYAGSDDDCNVEIVIQVDGLNWVTQFFRMNGYYSSYNGIEWDGDFQEVFPHPETKIVYKTTKA